MMNKSVYLTRLDELSRVIEAVPNTMFGMYVKVVNLALLNMRYEKVAFDRQLTEHPYTLVQRILDDQIQAVRAWGDTLFIENPGEARFRQGKQAPMEDKHRDLFNILWNKYDERGYDTYVDRYRRRLEINDLQDLVRDKYCLDVGCGNGNFCLALMESGARGTAGVDVGPDSIAFAASMAGKRGRGTQCEFQVGSAYSLAFPDDAFDFVIQNGVFHHLDDEMPAILEVKRVLKVGGVLWYYTDGEGGISYDLWDRSVHLLRDVPVAYMLEILFSMNVSREKIVHLMDGLNATYRHTSWKKVTEQLASAGFGDFRRLTGGFDTDFDLDVIEADPYGREKFGEGDLRVLAKLERK